MAIRVIDIIKQKNDASFPLIEDTDFLGGFRAVSTTTDRDDIPTTYRKEGMWVWSDDVGKVYRLGPGLTNLDWVEVTFGGGASDAITDSRTLAAGVSVTAGQPVALNVAGDLIAANAGPGLNPEIYGVAQAAAGPGPAVATVVTSGVCNYTGPALTPGDVLYLAVGGGILNSSPPNSTGNSIVRVGQARSATTLLVRVQFIARL